MKIQRALPIPTLGLLTLSAMGAVSMLTSMQSVSSPQPVSVLNREQKAILDLMSVVWVDDGMGGTVKTLRIEGVNLQLVNGTGTTGNSGNGRGNLILGYNEIDVDGQNRTGSHNLVLGRYNDYLAHSGIVAGQRNATTNEFTSVLGGSGNTAAANNSVIVAGNSGVTNGNGSAILSGSQNQTSSPHSAVVGGTNNAALAGTSVVVAGGGNQALGPGSAILGGQNNTTEGNSSIIAGGQNNSTSAGAFFGSILGGRDNLVDNYRTTVAGGVFNEALALDSTVLGGARNEAGGEKAVVVGGEFNTAFGNFSVVGGGFQRATADLHDWAAGALMQDL